MRLKVPFIYHIALLYKAVEEKKVLTVSTFLETHFKIEPNHKILRCFDLTETIFMYKKRMKNFAYKK